MMVKVFKTNVDCPISASKVIRSLLTDYPEYKVNFALEDEDRIFRVEAELFSSEDISFYLKLYGFSCIELPMTT